MTLLVLASAPVYRADSTPPEHEPIKIGGDQDLLLPENVSGNGVRSGSGTADDPFVIEHWTIQRGESEHAIWVHDTTLHLVIRNVTFAPEWSEGFWSSIFLSNSANVTVTDVTFRGYPDERDNKMRQVLTAVRGSNHLTLQDVEIADRGSVLVGASRNVAFRDVTLDGAETSLRLETGSFTAEDVTLRGSERLQSTEPAAIYLGPGERGNLDTCSLDADNVTIVEPTGPALRAMGCDAELEDVAVTGAPSGIVVEDGRIVLRESHLAGRKVDGFGDAFCDRGYCSRMPLSAFELSDGARLSGRDIDVTDFVRLGVSSGSSFDIRRSGFRDYDRGLRITGSCEDCIVRASTFLSGTTDYHIDNEGASTVDARRNWWGSADGPPDEMVEGDVLVEPWKTEGPAPPSQAGEGLPSFGVVLALVAASVAAGLGRRDP